MKTNSKRKLVLLGAILAIVATTAAVGFGASYAIYSKTAKATKKDGSSLVIGAEGARSQN